MSTKRGPNRTVVLAAGVVVDDSSRQAVAVVDVPVAVDAGPAVEVAAAHAASRAGNFDRICGTRMALAAPGAVLKEGPQPVAPAGMS